MKLLPAFLRPEKENQATASEWAGRFLVERTTSKNRKQAGADYVACINASVREKLKLGHEVVIVRHFDTGEPKRFREQRPPVLRARCRALVPDGKPPSDGQVLLDQTARNAVGIPFQASEPYTVDLAPIRRTGRRTLSEWLGNRVLRRRFLFMRVCSADPGDMEKRLARIPADAFLLLGASPGAKIVITHPVVVDGGPEHAERQHSLQTYALTDEIVRRRRKLESQGMYDRYPDAVALLGVNPDLGSIYLDEQARDQLSVRSLEVVRVRRDDLNAFLQRIRFFGLAIVAASIAIVGVFPIHKTFWNGVAVLAGALIAATVVSIINLRQATGDEGGKASG